MPLTPISFQAWLRLNKTAPPERASCPDCNESGLTNCPRCKGLGANKHGFSCSKCAGDGYLDCPICDGSGTIYSRYGTYLNQLARDTRNLAHLSPPGEPHAPQKKTNHSQTAHPHHPLPT